MGQPIEFKQGDETWKKLRKRAQTDLYWLCGKLLGLEDKGPKGFFMKPAVHYGMCRFAERKTGIPEVDASRIQMIACARGSGKSACITVGRTIQRLLNNQNWAAGIANESAQKAAKFLGSIKAEFESNDFLRFLFPELLPDFRKTIWASDQITIQRTKPDPINPSVAAVGTTSQTAGFHMNEWIVDDLISDAAAENARKGLFTEIEAANRWVTRLPPLLKRPQVDPLTFIYTPWFLGDTYQFIEDTFSHGEPEKRFMWLLDLPDGTTQQIELVQKGSIAKFALPIIDDAGHSIFPELISDEGYEHAYKQDPLFALSQYKLKPTGGLASDFKKEWLRDFEWEGNKKQIRYKLDDRTHFVRLQDLTTIISVDPAISKKDTAARSAICVTATDGQRIFLLQAWCGRVGATDLAQRIIEATKEFSPHRIIIETVAYQSALKEVLELLANQQRLPMAMFPLADFRPGPQMNKDARIYGLEPWMRKGLFYYNPRSQAEFEQEYVNFPNQKLRDILDALAMQAQHWERLNNAGRDAHGTRLHSMKQNEAARVAKIRAHYGKRGRG